MSYNMYAEKNSDKNTANLSRDRQTHEVPTPTRRPDSNRRQKLCSFTQSPFQRNLQPHPSQLKNNSEYVTATEKYHAFSFTYTFWGVKYAKRKMYHFIPVERAVQRHEVHSRCYATITATLNRNSVPAKHPLPTLPLSCSPAPGNLQSNFCVCESDYSIGLAKEAHLGFSVGTLASPTDASHRWDRIEFILLCLVCFT